jgi:hypothetical protein
LGFVHVHAAPLYFSQHLLGVSLILLDLTAPHAGALSNPRAGPDDRFAHERIFFDGRGDRRLAREVPAGRCRVARRISRMAFSALSFCSAIIVPLVGNDEPNVSLIQTTRLVQLLPTANTEPTNENQAENNRRATSAILQTKGRIAMKLMS